MLRAFKILIKTVSALFLLFLLVWIIVLGVLQTKPAQEWAIRSTLAYLEQKTGSHIKIGNIEIVFPLTIRIKNLAFVQEGETIATIEKFNATCTYGALLEGRIILADLNAEGINLLKIPLNKDKTPSSSNSWEAELLPFYLKIENLFLNNIRIHPDALADLQLPPNLREIAAHSRFSIKGFISNNPFRKGIYSHLKLFIEDLSAPAHPITLLLHTQRNFVTLTIEGNHLPSSLSKSLDLDSKFSIDASAPLNTWRNLLQNGPRLINEIEGNFKFDIRSLVTHSPLGTLLGDLTTVVGGYELNGDREFVINNVSIHNEKFDANAKVELSSQLDIRDCQFTGQTNDSTLLQSWTAKNLDGPLTFHGAISGSLERPAFMINLLSPELKIKDEVLNKVAVTLTTTIVNEQQTDGSLHLVCNFKNQPFEVAALFEQGPERLAVSHFELNGLASNVTGEFSRLLSDNNWEGHLKIQAHDLSKWSFLLPEPIAGEAQLHVLFSNLNADKEPTIDCTLAAHSVHAGQYHFDEINSTINCTPLDANNGLLQITSVVDGKNFFWNSNQLAYFVLNSSHQSNLEHTTIKDFKAILNGDNVIWTDGSIKEIDLYAVLDNPLEEIAGQVKFALRGINHSSLKIDQIEGETVLSNLSNDSPFSINGFGNWSEQWDAKAEGFWSYNKDQLFLHLSQFMGQLGPYPFKLLTPLDFSHQQAETSLSHFSFQLSDGVIDAFFKGNEQDITCEFKTNQIPTELFHFIAPNFPLNGRISFEGGLSGNPANPKGQLDVFLHHIQFAEEIFSKKPYIEGEINLELLDKGIRLQSTLNGIGSNPVVAEGTLPLSFTLLPFALDVGADIPFSLNLQADGELDPYLHLFYNDVTNITGQTKIALNLSGKMDDPHIQGTIDLYNGSFESLDTGALYKNIQARLEGSGSKIFLTQFTAHDNKKGSITATGEVTIDKNNDFPFEFKINPSQIFIMDSDYASIAVSGPLTLSGTTKKAFLKGNLTSDRAIVHLDQALPKQIKHIDIQYINAGSEEQPSVKAKSNNNFIELEVNLNLPDQVKIEGKNFSSEWKGHIVATGTPDDPLLNGDLRVIQGEYDFNGKAFLLTQGNIHFAGNPAKKTSLYIIASKDFDRIQAEIIVKGPTSKPVVSFRSNPPLSQREVLSYILFNRGIADITSDQGDQLSQSFIELNDSDQSNNSSKDFLTRLRNNIGIDRLDITSSDSVNKDVSLQVGKYITERVFVSVNKSISDVGNRVAIEAKLLKNLKAQAEVEVGGDTQGKVSLKWKKDY